MGSGSKARHAALRTVCKRRRGEGGEGRGGSALPANFHLNGVDVIHVCLELEKL